MASHTLEASNEELNTEASERFKIPVADLRSAVEAKEAGEPSFWSYKMYRDSAGNDVKVEYSTDISRSEDLARILADEPVLGFGMQWLEQGNSIVLAGEQAIDLRVDNNISLVVLAKEDMICIFNVALHQGSSVEEKIAPTLRNILESSTISKAGVLIFEFKDRRLLARFGINMKGIFELADLYHILRENSNRGRKSNKYYVPLNDLVEEHLHLDHYRPKHLRLSNWGREPLRENQISYAASDAYASYQLYQVMNRKRLKLSPVPPLPLLAEQQTAEQLKEKEVNQPSFIKKRRAEQMASTSQAVTNEGTVEQESPTKRKRKSKAEMAALKATNPSIILDSGEWFVWEQGEVVFNFGKHSGNSLQHVAAEDRNYLTWMSQAGKGFPADAVKIARDALGGRFPPPPQTEPALPSSSHS